ncbi:MAG: glycosyltransferase family 87 protein [Gaiellaceae bacterium]
MSLACLVRRATELLLVGLVPLCLSAGVLVMEDGSRGGVAYDFRRAFLPAAHAVANGRSPFGPATVAALRPGTAFVYPPVAAFVFAPLTWIPPTVAAYVVSLLVLVCAPATLWVLGVRDWRCYGASLLWGPVVESVRLGALSLPLALLVGVAWRYRDRAAAVGPALAAAIAVKLFLWPLLVWLAATRRLKSAAAVVATAAALVVAPWAALGFAGLTAYPHLLRVLSSIEAPESYTIAAVVSKADGGWRLGEVATYAAGGLLLAVVVRAARRRQDRRSFFLALAAALVLSPIVWTHYFALLLVPVAIMSPTFGPAWLLPAALFAFPITADSASWQAIAAALAIVAATVAVSSGWTRTALPARTAPSS